METVKTEKNVSDWPRDTSGRDTFFFYTIEQIQSSRLLVADRSDVFHGKIVFVLLSMPAKSTPELCAFNTSQWDLGL